MLDISNPTSFKTLPTTKRVCSSDDFFTYVEYLAWPLTVICISLLTSASMRALLLGVGATSFGRYSPSKQEGTVGSTESITEMTVKNVDWSLKYSKKEC